MSRAEALPPDFYRRPSEEVARDLLGRWIVRRLAGAGERLVLRIVETEAYQGEGDRASHAHAGPSTPRARRLFRDPGRAYVYLIYGIHHCMNAVTGTAEDGTAVLLRAGEPREGTDGMLANRGWERPPRPGDVAGGPGKLCQALGVDRAFDGEPLWQGSLVIAAGEPVDDDSVVRGPRVGVGYAGEAAEWPLRFAVRGNRHVSKPAVERG